MDWLLDHIGVEAIFGVLILCIVARICVGIANRRAATRVAPLMSKLKDLCAKHGYMAPEVNDFMREHVDNKTFRRIAVQSLPELQKLSVPVYMAELHRLCQEFGSCSWEVRAFISNHRYIPEFMKEMCKEAPDLDSTSN